MQISNLVQTMIQKPPLNIAADLYFLSEANSPSVTVDLKSNSEANNTNVTADLIFNSKATIFQMKQEG